MAKKGKAKPRWETVYEYDQFSNVKCKNGKFYDYRRLLQRREADSDG